MTKRILIVDDDLDFGAITKLTLEAAGPYKARAVSMARKCLPVARDFKPDLILLDCMMPAMDGGEVVSLLERDPLLKSVPVVFLTATVSEREVRPSICYSGVRTYLPKFIRIEALVREIEGAIAGGAAQTAAAS